MAHVTQRKPPKKQPRATTARALPDRVQMVIDLHREPMQPLPAWAALAPDGLVDGLHLGQELDDLLRSYQSGEHVALLLAFKLCAYFRVIPPDWVLFETGRAMTLYTTAHVRTLDEAFRVSRRKNEKIEGTRNTIMLTNGIRLAVDRARAQGAHVNMILFAEVGEGFGISESTCESLYYGR